MSEFKEKLSMFESTLKPPMKPKPTRSIRLLPAIPQSLTNKENDIAKKCEDSAILKNEDSFVAAISNENESMAIELESAAKVLNEKRKIDDSNDVVAYSEPIESEKVTAEETVTENVDEDLAYNFFESSYDLPGLEIFILDKESKEIPSKVLQSKITVQREDKECYFDPTDEDKETVELAPSTLLIEEIYNWRTSGTFSDGTASAFSDASADSIYQSNKQLSYLEEEKRKSSRGNIFTNLFKRTQKKTMDKVNVKDTTAIQESLDTTKSNSENDINGSKKPLDELIGRDLINDIGEGVKKKATVMSELRKMFSHGKFTRFRKKTIKNVLDSNVENQQKPLNDPSAEKLKNLKVLNSKSRNEILQSEINKGNKENSKRSSINKNGQNVFGNYKRDVKVKDSDDDSIYDEDDTEEPTQQNEEIPGTNKIILPVVASARATSTKSDEESVYDDDEEIDVEEEKDKSDSILKTNEKNLKTQKQDKKQTSKHIENGLLNSEFKKAIGKCLKKTEYQETSTKTNVANNTVAHIIHAAVEEYGSEESIYDDEQGEDEKVCMANSTGPNMKEEMASFSKHSHIYDDDNDAVVEDVEKQGKNKPSYLKQDMTKKCSKKDKKKNEKSKIANKNKFTKHDEYDEDPVIIEEYTSDIDNSDGCKQKKDDIKYRKDVKTKIGLHNVIRRIEDKNIIMKLDPRKLNKAKKNVKESELYDEDDVMIEEYESEDSIYDDEVEEEEEESIANSEDDIIKQAKSVNKSKNSNLSQDLTKNCPKKDKKKNEKSKIAIKKKFTNNDEYDEDPVIVEEYMSDADNSDGSKQKKDDNKYRKENISKNVKTETGLHNVIRRREDRNITTKPVKKEVARKFNKAKKNVKESELYDEDDVMIEEYESENSIYDDEEEYDKEKNSDSKKDEPAGAKKIKIGFHNIILPRLPVKAIEKKVTKETKKLRDDECENNCEIYDDDGNDAVDTEIYVEDDNDEVEDCDRGAKKNPVKKVEAGSKSKSSLASKLSADIKRRQRNIKTNINNLLTSSYSPERIRKKKKANEDKDEELEATLAMNKSVEEAEDDALKKLIKKNIERAKKTFKLKEPIRTIAMVRALKTIYIESKLGIQFNIGEILDVLEYRNDMVLVKNGVGKCGLTSINNVQTIKNGP